MKLSLGARRNWLVVASFAGFMAMGLGLGYLRDLLPSFTEKCTAQCKVSGQEGHMVYVYPAAMTAGTRGRGPEKCECFAPGTFNPNPR